MTKNSFLANMIREQSALSVFCEIQKKDCTTYQIINKLKFPQTTVYRSIKHLKEAGIVRIKKYNFTKFHKKEAVYTTDMKKVILVIENGNLIML